MSTMLEDLKKPLRFYNDGESNLAHAYAMSFVVDHHATIAQNAEAVEVLKRIKFRLHFMGWPAEAMWNAGSKDHPSWIEDWRYEIALIEHVLHGSPVNVIEKPTDTTPRNQLPVDASTEASKRLKALERAVLEADDEWFASQLDVTTWINKRAEEIMRQN